MTNSGGLRKLAKRVRPKLKTDGNEWPAGTIRVMMHRRVATVNAHHPYLVEEEYFRKVIANDELKKPCRRIIGVVAPTNTYEFNADLFHAKTRLEQLSYHPINMGQLLSQEKDQRGQLAQKTYGRFFEFISERSGDFSGHGEAPWKGRRGAHFSAYGHGVTCGDSRMDNSFGVAKHSGQIIHRPRDAGEERRHETSAAGFLGRAQNR